MAIQLLKLAVEDLVSGMTYKVPDQDLCIRLSRFPAVPARFPAVPKAAC